MKPSSSLTRPVSLSPCGGGGSARFKHHSAPPAAVAVAARGGAGTRQLLRQVFVTVRRVGRRRGRCVGTRRMRRRG